MFHVESERGLIDRRLGHMGITSAAHGLLAPGRKHPPPQQIPKCEFIFIIGFSSMQHRDSVARL